MTISDVKSIHIMQNNCYTNWILLSFLCQQFMVKYINQLDALISQIYSGIKLYIFRTIPLSIIRSLFIVHTEELSETCRVSWQNKFVKLVHLAGCIIKKFVTTHGHTNIKYFMGYNRAETNSLLFFNLVVFHTVVFRLSACIINHQTQHIVQGV